MRYLIVPAIAVFLTGCIGVTKNSKFPEEKMLTSQPVTVDTFLLRYPYRIVAREDVILVMDLHPEQDYLHAFSLPEGKHIASFGRRGQGGEEMLSAENFRFNSLDSIWILDANRMNIVRWSFSAFPAVAGREEVINLDKTLVRTLDFCLTDSGFIVPDYTGESRYNFVDRKGNAVGAAGVIPSKANRKASPIALAQGWRSFFALNPAGNMLVAATQLGEVLEIYRLDSDAHTVVYGSQGEPRFYEAQGEGIPDGIMGYFDVQMTEHYIYALFSGQSLKEIRQNAMAGRINERGGRYIHVFDLEGKPVCKYILDRSVCGIDVRESEQIIYAVDANSNDPIVAFRIAQPLL